MSSLRRFRRPVPRRLAAAVVTALCAVALVSAIPSSATAATSATAAPACPTGSFTFTSTLSNGSFTIGKFASSTGATASACGGVSAVNGVLTSLVKKENVTFEPTSTKVLFLNLPTTVVPTTDMTGPATLNPDFTLDVSLAGSVLVSTNVLGQNCTFPLDLKLTTGTSGALTGTTLKADASGNFVGKLVANDFTVPKLKSTKQCNVLVATFTNGLLGLPLAAGKSQVSFDISLKLTI